MMEIFMSGENNAAAQAPREKERAKRENCNWERATSLLSLIRATRIEIQIEAELGQRLQGKGEEETVFLHAAIIADDCANGRNPTRQIAIDRVALLFQNACSPFVLFPDAEAPVVIDSIMAAQDIEAAVVEEWVLVQVSMGEIDLKICDRLDVHARVQFGESLLEHGHL